MGGTAVDDTERGPGGGDAYAPGVRVAGRYEIVRFLAAGGMGEVYEARDLLVGGAVALKTLRADLNGAARAIERLRREVALARRITHPNVCRMHDVGDHDGRVFLTMELLRGTTLADRIRTGPVPDAELARIAGQLIAGLAAAHAAGVVHRDLKPGNVILDGDRATITDFGLARSAEPDDEVALTGEAALLGTPGYLAPELVEGRTATAASDIYALGVVLYELATGRPPFREDTAMATATARLHKDPPPLGRDVDPRWSRAIMRCLARDPARRYARVEDVGTDAPPRRRWRWPVIAALGVAVAGGVTWRVVDDAPARRAAPIHARLRPASEKAAVHFEEAQRALAADDRVAARELLEQAVAAAPDDPLCQAALADVLAQLGYTERARDAITRARGKAAALTGEPRAYVDLVAATIDHDPAAAVAAAKRLDRGFALRLAAAQLDADDPTAAAATVDALGASEPIGVDLARARIARAAGDPTAMLASATRAAERAHQAHRPHDEGEALTLVGSASWLAGDTAGAATALRRAIDVGDSGVIVRARAELIDLQITLDRMGDVTDLYVAQADTVRTLGDRAALTELLLDGAGFLVENGELTDVPAMLDEARALATALHDDVELGWCDAVDAFFALQTGRLADAARFAERAFDAGDRLAVGSLRGNSFHTWTEALLELGDDAELARARARRGDSVERLIDAFAALREGDLDRAERIARTLANLRTGEGRFAEGVVALVEVRRGAVEDAQRRLDALVPVALGDGASFYARDRLVRTQAELAARRGDLPRALSLLDDHAAKCAAVGLGLGEVMSLALAAQLSRDAGREAKAIARAEALGFRRVVRELER